MGADRFVGNLSHRFGKELRSYESESYRQILSQNVEIRKRRMSGGNEKNRLPQWKNAGKTQEKMRDRDRDVTVELRKNKRDDTLTKKRQIEGLTIDSTDDEDLRENLSTASLETIVEKARSADQATQLAAVQAARK